MVYPTPKSDGAAQMGVLQSSQKLGTSAESGGAGGQSDFDNFNEINSQDDALTQQMKDEKANGIRKGMKSFASNIVGKANSLLQTTGSAVANMAKAKSSEPVVKSEESKQPSSVSPPDGTVEEVNEDPTKMSEDEQKRIMRMIEQEDSSDEDDDLDDDDESGQSGKGGAKKEAKGGEGSDNDSFCSDNDILNRSLQSDCGDPASAENYLRYASEEYSRKIDILEIIDKNERSFKQVAEKMIQQSS